MEFNTSDPETRNIVYSTGREYEKERRIRKDQLFVENTALIVLAVIVLAIIIFVEDFTQAMIGFALAVVITRTIIFAGDKFYIERRNY